jgi:hypothetical protein
MPQWFRSERCTRSQLFTCATYEALLYVTLTMAILGRLFYAVFLIPVVSTSGIKVQFVMQREALPGKVWFQTGVISSNETHVVANKASGVTRDRLAIFERRVAVCTR